MGELLRRLRLYETQGGVDWVQFESPHSVDEIKRARRVVKGPFSAMKGRLPRALTLKEHEEIGLNAAWYTFLPDLVLKTAAWSFFQDFKDKDMRAWDEFAVYRRRKAALGRNRHDRVEQVRSELRKEIETEIDEHAKGIVDCLIAVDRWLRSRSPGGFL
jgi:2-methylisocitrate lyase-like PEP mutase family enzyme